MLRRNSNRDPIVDRNRPLGAKLCAEERVDERRFAGVELAHHDNGEKLIQSGQQIIDAPPFLGLFRLERLPQLHQELVFPPQRLMHAGVND